MIKKLNKIFKIIQVIPRPDGGGAEKLVRELCLSLHKNNFDVTTIYFYNPSKIKLNKNEYCLNLLGPRDIRAVWYLRKMISNFAKKKKIIIHSHLTWPLYFLTIATYNIKTIDFYTEHNNYNYRRKFFFLKYIERLIYSRCYKIICNSNSTKNSLIRWLKNKHINQKIIVILNGARLFKIVKRKKINPKRLKLVSIGSLNKKKGFDVAIKAIAQVKNDIHKYTIIGEGSQKKKLLNLSRKLNIENKVFLTGYIKNIEPYLSNMDIGLIPSRWEGFGLVSVEMLSTGMPLICSNVPGLSEVVNKCLAVELVKSNNSVAITKGILKLIKKIKNQDTNVIVEHARKRAEKFDIQLFCDNYKNLYLDAISKFN